MGKSRNHKWFDTYDEDVNNNHRKEHWKNARRARQLKSKMRNKNLEYREEEDDETTN